MNLIRQQKRADGWLKSSSIAVMIVPLLALVLIQSTNVPQGLGSDLYQQCQAGIRLLDAPKAPDTDLFPGTVCISYISGVLDGLSMGDEKLVCVNSYNYSLGTLMRVYVAFMKQYPKEMDEPELSGLYQALAVAYACPTALNPPKPNHLKK